MKFAVSPGNRQEILYWIAAAFLVATFLMGGSSRINVHSLIILGPLSILACAAALITLRREHVLELKWLFAGFAAIFMLAALHLVPLPAGLWHALAGRDDLVAVDRLAGQDGLWRPLTVTPMNGWHALASLFAPLAVLLFGAQLNREQLYRFLPIVILLGALSGLFGLLQVIGSPTGPLYLYRTTNNGSAVGLFANRNHAALFLAIQFPLLALWAAQQSSDRKKQRARIAAAAILALLLLPLILVTGSRSGLIVLGLSMIASAAVYGGTLFKQGGGTLLSGRKAQLVFLAAAAAIAALIYLTLHFSRAESVRRVVTLSFDADSRAAFWPVCVELFWKYFPIGSGSGSFVEVYQIAEPLALLDTDYLNHAHNDFLEIGITFGVPGILLLLAALALYVRKSITVWQPRAPKGHSIQFARAAGMAMFFIAAASVTDYPLRTPALACLFMLFALWFAKGGRKAPATTPAPSGSGA